jgi:hypothetical protein
MKQLLVLVVFVAILLGAYALFRDGDRPGTTPGGVAPGPSAPIQPPDRQRPQVSGSPKVEVDEALLRQMGEKPTWYDAVSEADIVRVEDAWNVDLATVDFAAPTLITVGGVPITQQDWRRHAVLAAVPAAVDSALIDFAGRRMARLTGQPYGLSEAEHQALLESWGRSRGLDADAAARTLGLAMKLPPALAVRARRQVLDAVLAYYVPTESLEDLPDALRRSIESHQESANVIELLRILNLSRSPSDDPGRIGSLAAVTEALGLYMQDVGKEERLRRTWTALDDELPDGAVAAYADADLEEGVVLPPWMLPGERQLVATDPLYEMLLPTLARPQMERLLEALVWAKVLRAKLESEGALLDPAEAWRAYAAEYLRAEGGLLTLDLIATQYQGYPSMAFYRQADRLRRSFVAAQPAGFDSDDVLREFFERNSFFVMGWVPQLQVALFPPRDFEHLPEDLAEWQVDWERSRGEAQAFAEAARQGDFKALLDEHNANLVSKLRAALGEDVAQRYVEEFRGGELAVPMAQVETLLKDNRWRQQVQAYNVVQNAVARLKKGEVSDPWRTEIGWIVARVEDARMGKLEEEYEDLAEQTRSLFHDMRFMRWVNDSLKGLPVE